MRTVCRACFARDVTMHSIEDVQLQEIYEKLAGAEIKPEAGMPYVLCYICYSQLRSCAAFSAMAQNSTRILRNVLQKGIKGSISSVDPAVRLKHNLSVSAIRFMSLNDCLHVDHIPLIKEEIVVKEEPEVEATNQHVIENNKHVTRALDILVNSVQSVNDVKAEQVVIKIEKLENEEFIEIDDPQSDILSGVSLENTIMIESNELDDPINIHLKRRSQMFTCHMCNKTFRKEYYLRQHRKVHNKEPLSCKVCGRICSFPTNLSVHMRIHTGEKPFNCDMCGRAFRFKTSLIPHLRSHTGHRPYPCVRCDKKFGEASTLRRHMLVHTREKAFACTRCHTTFTEAGSLRRHNMQVHDGRCPQYSCDVCQKTFTRTDHLKRHVLTHNAEKPYACDRCDKSYTEASTLKRHKQTRHT